jgi:hypothetical protein
VVVGCQSPSPVSTKSIKIGTNILGAQSVLFVLIAVTGLIFLGFHLLQVSKSEYGAGVPDVRVYGIIRKAVARLRYVPKPIVVFNSYHNPHNEGPGLKLSYIRGRQIERNSNPKPSRSGWYFRTVSPALIILRVNTSFVFSKSDDMNIHPDSWAGDAAIIFERYSNLVISNITLIAPNANVSPLNSLKRFQLSGCCASHFVRGISLFPSGNSQSMGIGDLLSHFFNLLPNQANHLICLIPGLLHLPKLSLHGLELKVVDSRNRNAHEYGCNLHTVLPPRRLIGAAFSAFFIASWGWFQIRNGLRTSMGFWAFITGCGLWVYAFSGWLKWALRL